MVLSVNICFFSIICDKRVDIDFHQWYKESSKKIQIIHRVGNANLQLAETTKWVYGA